MKNVSLNQPKTCVVLQPGYLPWLGFFEQMLRADEFVYLDDVQFDKHGWRNRNRIKGPAGPQWLTVPVRLSGLDKPRINDVLIDPSKPQWVAKHLKTLRNNYGSCPYFEWLYPELEELLNQPWTHIADLDIALVELLCEKMALSRRAYRSSRLEIMEGRCERLINICRKLDCDTYYSGAAARDYIDLEAFRHAGIEVVFVSHLSVIDLMFNCGPQSVSIIAEPTLVGSSLDRSEGKCTRMR